MVRIIQTYKKEINILKVCVCPTDYWRASLLTSTNNKNIFHNFHFNKHFIVFHSTVSKNIYQVVRIICFISIYFGYREFSDDNDDGDNSFIGHVILFLFIYFFFRPSFKKYAVIFFLWKENKSRSSSVTGYIISIRRDLMQFF